MISRSTFNENEGLFPSSLPYRIITKYYKTRKDSCFVQRGHLAGMDPIVTVFPAYSMVLLAAMVTFHEHIIY